MNGISGPVNNPYPMMNVSEKTYGTVVRSEASRLKRVANGSDPDSVQQNRTYGASSIISSAQAFASTVRESRIKSKETSNEVKKLQYNFKDISSQIMRSKNSLSAKQAASKARREVLRLRRAKAGGQYDEEEVNAALEHAKSMERVAKKKAAHLQQEELIHITDKEGNTKTAEELKEHPEKLGDEEEDVLDELTATDQAKPQDKAPEDLSGELSENIEEITAQLTERMSGQMDDLMQEMSDLMSEQMDDMLENMEMLTEMSAVPREMSEADYKKLVTKHRTEEMKEMAEADREYLKFIFEKYQKMKDGGSGVSGVSSGAFTPAAAASAGMEPFATGMAADLSASGGGFDVSV
ncbi:MAG: hypothetical protein IJS12_06460 [Lachnospiraceae bacterium]|nr:hypothetical protein [Lachnospiraceae bacterium]